jgi:hypothetical protein
MEHCIHPDLVRRRVRVPVVGCGATGSAVATGLPYLHQALIACGHPGGLDVTVMDGDVISPSQGGRAGEPVESPQKLLRKTAAQRRPLLLRNSPKSARKLLILR